MHDDLGRIDAGFAREVELPGRGDVGAKALLGDRAQHGRARERFAREDDLYAAVVGSEGGLVLAGAGTQLGLIDDVGGRAVALGQLTRGNATEQEATLVHRRSGRPGGTELSGDVGHSHAV